MTEKDLDILRRHYHELAISRPARRPDEITFDRGSAESPYGQASPGEAT